MWLDNRYVTMLADSYISEQIAECQRWSGRTQGKVSQACARALNAYVKGMGAVDMMDQNNQRANVRMNRCPRRYHRRLFYWLMSTIGYHNMRIAVEALLPPEMLEELKRQQCNFGYGTWFQDELADQVIKYGLDMAKAEVGTPNTRQTQQMKPYFQPKRRRRGQTKLQMRSGAHVAVPESHAHVDSRIVKIVTEYKN
jgi:hypothetical protein